MCVREGGFLDRIKQQTLSQRKLTKEKKKGKEERNGEEEREFRGGREEAKQGI